VRGKGAQIIGVLLLVLALNGNLTSTVVFVPLQFPSLKVSQHPIASFENLAAKAGSQNKY